MSNHFHLLLEVPPRKDLQLSDVGLLERLGLLYSEVRVAEVARQLADFRERGLENNVEDYRWSSYGQACAGDRVAQVGLARVMAKNAGDRTADGKPLAGLTWKKAAAQYREFLFLDGEQRKDSEGKKGRRGIARETVAKVSQRKGQMTAAELVRCRVRHFTQGMVLGSREFVEEVFAGTREFYAVSRETGPRKIPGATQTGLMTTRQLPRPVR
jgi:hypothetical protein